MPILVVVVAAAIGLLVFLLLKKRPISEFEARLLELCRGDTGQLERLIAAERRRAPRIGRALAAQRALLALERDRR
jgi:hypothetical protein